MRSDICVVPNVKIIDRPSKLLFKYRSAAKLHNVTQIKRILFVLGIL